MPCTRDTKQCKTTHDYTPLPKCCKNHILEILDTVTDLFEKEGITYWLDYGTVLGATRDGKMIPWDRDADIGMLEEDVHKLENLLDTLKSKGFHIRWRNYGKEKRSGSHCKVSLSNKNGRHLCIFIWYEDLGMLRRWGYIGMRDKLGTDTKKGGDFPKEWVNDLKKIEFEGKKYYTHEDSERLSRHRYGKKWKTPLNIADWNKVDESRNNSSKYSSIYLEDKLDIAPVLQTKSLGKCRVEGLSSALEYGFKNAARLSFGDPVVIDTGVNSSVDEFIKYIPEPGRSYIITKHPYKNTIRTGNQYSGNINSNIIKFKKDIERSEKKISLMFIADESYVETASILKTMKPHLDKNTMLVFENFYNFDKYKSKQYKAFSEFTKKFKIPYKILAKTDHRQAIIFLQ